MRPVPGLVVKLGGSLAESGHLDRVLALVARSRRPLVLVPGGGAYADAVRARQRAEGFSDREAHKLALLAMHRTAHDMMQRQPRLVAASTCEEMRSASSRGGIPVWLPLRLALRDATLPADWSLTSDGLAARLAERLGSREVILVKSGRVRRSDSPKRLARLGVVDPCFPRVVARAHLCWSVLGPGDERALALRLGMA